MSISFTLTRRDFGDLQRALTGQDTTRAFWLVRVILPLMMGSAAIGNLAFTIFGPSPVSYLVALFSRLWLSVPTSLAN